MALAQQCSARPDVPVSRSLNVNSRRQSGAQEQGLGPLQQRLNYQFSDVKLLEHALTHSSAISPGRRVAESYQRLEFLGDRVLGLVIADMLEKKLPNANEGELSRTLNALVRKESCATIARQLEMGKALRLGESEARSGGAEKDAILADVAEAVIGAIFLDGGFDKAYVFVAHFFGQLLDLDSSGRNDAKTALQEWAQGRGLEPPTYREVSRSGPDHAPEFKISVEVAGFKSAESIGKSKKIAEHIAAENFLRRENIWKSEK